MEPLISAAKARKILGALKGCAQIDHNTLGHVVLKEGLPKHDDPFGSGRWCFLESEITAWYQSRLASSKPPLRGPGRPRKS